MPCLRYESGAAGAAGDMFSCWVSSLWANWRAAWVYVGERPTTAGDGAAAGTLQLSLSPRKIADRRLLDESTYRRPVDRSEVQTEPGSRDEASHASGVLGGRRSRKSHSAATRAALRSLHVFQENLGVLPMVSQCPKRKHGRQVSQKAPRPRNTPAAVVLSHWASHPSHVQCAP